LEIAVRFLWIAAVLATASLSASAADAVSFEPQPSEVAQPAVAIDMEVTVTPIPAPTMGTVLLKEFSPSPQVHPTKKPKLAKKQTLPKSMLSRTERHQMALMAAAHKNTGPSLLDFFNDEDAGSSAEDLDLHRFFSRPKLAKLADQDDEESDQDIELSDTVKVRLLLARMKAVQAHQNKFS
jgi:hypothetical protein